MLGHRRITVSVLAGLTAVIAPAAALLAPAASAGPSAAHAAAAATTPAADCQPFASKPCLLPFPNNLFTRKDKTTPTGVRVHLPSAAMPVNTQGRAGRRRTIRPQRRFQPRERDDRSRQRAR